MEERPVKNTWMVVRAFALLAQQGEKKGRKTVG